MKRIISLLVGVLMLGALLVGSGDPMVGASAKEIITTEAVCLAVLVGGALYFWRYYKEDLRP